jgi:hypothetical protein
MCLSEEVDLSGMVAVVHNGDIIDVALVKEVARRVSHVYCVNWIEESPRVSPVPIGLENAWHRTNGRPSLFADCVPHLRPRILAKPRSLKLLAGFTLSTNPEQREPALRMASQVGGSLVNSETPAQYQTLLADAQFTLSPPGNGLDCHRTWESIYRGSVPIVLKAAWPFGDFDLPVLVVDSWDEIGGLLEDSKKASELWHEIAARDARPAFASFWVSRFMGAT